MPKTSGFAGRQILLYGGLTVLGVFVFIILLGNYDLNKEKRVANKDEGSRITLSVGGHADEHHEADGELASAVASAESATRELAKKLAAEIVANNPGGPGSKA